MGTCPLRQATMPQPRKATQPASGTQGMKITLTVRLRGVFPGIKVCGVTAMAVNPYRIR